MADSTDEEPMTNPNPHLAGPFPPAPLQQQAPAPPQRQAPAYPPHPEATHAWGPPQGMPVLPLTTVPAHAPAPIAAPRTVFGVPLEPGERVVFFCEIDRTMTYVETIVLGLLSIWFLVGFYILYTTTRIRRNHGYAHVITNRRLIHINGEGKVLSQMAWRDVAGPFTKTLNGTLTHAGVHARDGRQTLFDKEPQRMRGAITRYCNDIRLLELDPEVPFRALPA